MPSSVANVLKPHPIASIFPLLEGDDLAALAADILAHGLREPITLHEGLILDGRNRYAACLRVSVEPRFETWDDDGSALAWVMSKNLHRRQLTTRQKAEVAIAALPYAEEEARRRQEASRAKPGEKIGDKVSAGLRPPSNGNGKAAAEVAALVGVSPRTVESMIAVHRDASPALTVALKSPDMTIFEAERIVRSSAPDNRAAREAEKAAKEAKERADAEEEAKQKRLAEEARARAAETQSKAINHRAQGTGENEWYTPVQYVDAARSLMGTIDLDPASSATAQKTVRAKKFFDKDDDGLSRNWEGRVWLNPPYAQPAIRNFADKVIAEVDSKRVSEAVVLTHNYTDTAWFHILAAGCTAICFTRGRIAFLDPDGNKAAPTQGQAFFYFGKNTDAFKFYFRAFGFVVASIDRDES